MLKFYHLPALPFHLQPPTQRQPTINLSFPVSLKILLATALAPMLSLPASGSKQHWLRESHTAIVEMHLCCGLFHFLRIKYCCPILIWVPLSFLWPSKQCLTYRLQVSLLVTITGNGTTPSASGTCSPPRWTLGSPTACSILIREVRNNYSLEMHRLTHKKTKKKRVGGITGRVWILFCLHFFSHFICRILMTRE